MKQVLLQMVKEVWPLPEAYDAGQVKAICNNEEKINVLR